MRERVYGWDDVGDADTGWLFVADDDGRTVVDDEFEHDHDEFEHDDHGRAHHDNEARGYHHDGRAGYYDNDCGRVRDGLLRAPPARLRDERLTMQAVQQWLGMTPAIAVLVVLAIACAAVWLVRALR